MMSKLLKLTMLPALITLVAACDQAPTALDDATIPGPDLAVIVNDQIQIPFAVFVPCAADGAGELVLSDLRLHVKFSQTIDAHGGVHATSHFQPMGGNGVGLTTGDVYRATGITRDGFNVDFDGLPFETTLVNNFRWIGPGPGNNLLVHSTIHVTFNANGDVTAVVNNSSAECK